MMQRIFPTALAIVSTMAFPTVGSEIAAAKICADIASDADRLVCFDTWIATEIAGAEAPAAATNLVETSSYVPRNTWKFRQDSSTSAAASVVSPSGRSALSVTCNANKTNPWLEFYPEGWIPNEIVQVVVDDRVFDVGIDGGDGAILSNLPDLGLGIDRELLNALTNGSKVSLIGPATAKMKDDNRIYSLAGSSAAIARVLRYCKG